MTATVQNLIGGYAYSSYRQAKAALDQALRDGKLPKLPALVSLHHKSGETSVPIRMSRYSVHKYYATDPARGWDRHPLFQVAATGTRGVQYAMLPDGYERVVKRVSRERRRPASRGFAR